MANLTEDQKMEIVSGLASFRTTSEITAAFRSNHGLELDRKQVGRYHPRRCYYAGGEKWRQIFEVKREAYLKEVSSVPIAHQAFRRHALQEQYDKAVLKEQPAIVLSVLEQAAKEIGGMFTNQRELRVDDNRRLRPSEMPIEDRRAAFAELIRKAMEIHEQRLLAPLSQPTT